VRSIDPLVSEPGDLVTVVLMQVTQELVQDVTLFLNGDTVLAPEETVWDGNTGASITFVMPNLQVIGFDGSTTIIVRLGSGFQLAQQR
jgi:hypothetical protein